MAYSTITKPSLHFNTTLFTGNGANDNAQTGVGFQPDWTWIKARSQGYDHMLFDRVRQGSNAQPFEIRSNLTNAQSTDTSGVKSFDSDGFTLNNGGYVNGNGVTFASWNWKANGAGSANTDGSINTTATSVNTTAGFSIVKYTGTGSNATVGHGLGVAPKVIINKNINSTAWWGVYHESLGNTNAIYLNTTNATDASVQYWNNTSPTSSVFSVGTNSISNASGGTYISYCFAEKKGYSKFGSYTGNGNNDGTFVYTGFKPAWVMVKQTNAAGNSWHIKDNKRNTFNAVDKYVHPDLSAAEGTVTLMDFLSNGFKMRVNDTTSNQGSILYMAFAENPFVTSTGIPTTAR